LNDKQLQRRAAELADQIEAEMRRIGIWRAHHDGIGVTPSTARCLAQR
jgi:hypothetical protein